MTKPLPVWIERLLGVHTEPGEGMAWSLHHSWSWPAWLTLLFAVFAVVFVVTTYLRENRQSPTWFRLGLAGIRLALIGIVLLMLAQFALSLQRTGLPYVAVLVDDSLSMSVVDRYADELQSLVERRIGAIGYERPSRWNLARTLLIENKAALLRGIRKQHKLRMYFLAGERSSPSAEVGKLLDELRSLEPASETSRLGEAVRTVLSDLRGSAPAAIVLLTDGINTDGPPLSEAAALARRKGVPLFTIGLGDDRPVRDLELTDLLVDDVVFAGDVVYFEAKLSGTGYEGKQVDVVLRREDKPDVLAKAAVTVDAADAAQAVRLPYRPNEEGEFRYVVEVEPQEGELQTDNNRQQRTVQVRKEQIRVLLVQAYPSFEYRYLRNMLARDVTIDLDTVLQEADIEHAEQDASALKGFPVRRDELFRYDVIILGDVNPSLLSESMLQNLADFVDQAGRGGALIAIAGPRFMPLAYRDTPLARLLPIELGSVRLPEPGQMLTEGFTVQPTELGLATPFMQLGDAPAETSEIWQNLPPLYWMVEAPDLKPAARVLAEHPECKCHLAPNVHSDVGLIAQCLEALDDRLRRTRVTVGAYDAGPEGWRAAYGAHRGARAALAMRFHANMVSVGLGVPTTGLSSHHKVSGLYREMGLADRCVECAPGSGGDALSAAFRQVRADLEPAAATRARDRQKQARDAARKKLKAYHARLGEWLSDQLDGRASG